jgi:hypothetical protein
MGDSMKNKEKTMITKLYKKHVVITILVMSFLLSGCGTSEKKLAATKTKIAADIFTTQTAVAPTLAFLAAPTATNTLKPSQKKTLTSVSQATSEAQPMANLIPQLYYDGYLKSMQGEYLHLADFVEHYDQIGVNYYSEEEINLENFVLRSDISWKNANDEINPEHSGCGFWFGYNERLNQFHRIILTLGGNVRFSQCLNCDQLETIARNYFGKIDYMQGDVEMIIIVDRGTIQTFVNKKRVFVRQDQKQLKGLIGYAIVSGTNADFGTQCTFKNTEIWSLEP